MKTKPIRLHVSSSVPHYEERFLDVFLKKNYPDEIPGEEQKVLKCQLIVGKNKINLLSYGNHLFINEQNDGYYNNGWVIDRYYPNKKETVETPPFATIEPIGCAYHKIVTKKVYEKPFSYYGDRKIVEVSDYDTYTIGNHYHDNEETIRYNYLDVEIKVHEEIFKATLKFKRPDYGVIDLKESADWIFKAECDFFGLKLDWKIDTNNSKYSYHDERWVCFHNILTKYDFKQGIEKAWEYFFKLWFVGNTIDSKGISSIENRKQIAPNLERLKNEKPNLYNLFRFLHSSATTKGVTNNQLLSVWLKRNGDNYDKLSQDLQNVLNKIPSIDRVSVQGQNNNINGREICLLFEEAREKVDEKRSQKEWHLKKTLTEQATALGCDPETYPQTHQAISESKIPISVFHNPGDKLNVVNTEFSLWEKAMNRGWNNALFEIASDASRHSTYEKDITPYISFLFKIEKYLERHTGRKWAATPQYVKSEWQLEMEEANETGTVKKRSALTPIADNSNNTITIPYAAIAVHGRQTTYCYSKHYYVFEEDMIDPESGSPIVNELEEKLNGRDDYGLMYYTLNGTPRNRGYPTFLIIFERISSGTRVHFHRVHPNRYKTGHPTPAHKLVEECYRYMAGNIRAEEIYCQQGDLIFIRAETPKYDPEDLKGVVEFESHKFIPENGGGVKLLPNTAKSIKNRLGHLYCDGKFVVDHPEHEPLKGMPAGWYEIRRCKSWEANPQAVWSYTID